MNAFVLCKATVDLWCGVASVPWAHVFYSLGEWFFYNLLHLIKQSLIIVLKEVLIRLIWLSLLSLFMSHFIYCDAWDACLRARLDFVYFRNKVNCIRLSQDVTSHKCRWKLLTIVWLLKRFASFMEEKTEREKWKSAFPLFTAQFIWVSIPYETVLF